MSVKYHLKTVSEPQLHDVLTPFKGQGFWNTECDRMLYFSLLTPNFYYFNSACASLSVHRVHGLSFLMVVIESRDFSLSLFLWW